MARWRLFSTRIARSSGGNALVFALLLVVAVFMGLPLVYAVVQAFKPFEEIFIFPPRFFVRRPTLDNFTNLFILSSNLWVPFSRYIFNSIFVAATVTFLHVLFASAAAYPLAKHDFPGRAGILQIVIAALLFTGWVTYVPQYVIAARMGIINTYAALILPPIGSTLGLFLMQKFMVQIPASLLESARIEGVSEYAIFWYIVMPNVKPAWLTLTIFAFQVAWNSPQTAFIYDEQLKLLPTAMAQIASAGIARMGVGNAAAVFLLVPPVVLFVLSQASVLQTMAHAGIKE